jgi:hypothetical protein
MTLFHGTNRDITDGTATGTYFTDDFEIALCYMREKKGNKVYAFSLGKYDVGILFDKNWEGHYVSMCFIPIDKLVKLEVQA